MAIPTKNLLSPNNVSNIYYKNDTLWIAGRNKLEFRVEGDSTIRLLTTFKENIRVSSPICCTDDGYIYIGMNKGLLRIDRAQPERQHSLLPDIKVQSLYQDSQKNLWICTSRQGVYRLAPDGSILNFRNLPDNTNSLSNNDVRCAIEDDLGNLWFGTFYGLNKYNPSTQVWENHVHQNNISHSLSHSSIFALYKDTQGGIWIGTYFGGVNYYNPTDDHTSYYEANPDMPHALNFPVVGKMQEDAEHNLCESAVGFLIQKLKINKCK